jgi:hypothetical protein
MEKVQGKSVVCVSDGDGGSKTGGTHGMFALFCGANHSADQSAIVMIVYTEECIPKIKGKNVAAPRGRCSASFYVFVTLINIQEVS